MQYEMNEEGQFLEWSAIVDVGVFRLCTFFHGAHSVKAKFWLASLLLSHNKRADVQKEWFFGTHIVKSKIIKGQSL
jgi:hypothetical protein